jgi:transposase-like protein
MSPKKLTEPTKKEILQLYRETEATTSTLAERYEVSSSTISRFLKTSLSELEYEDLIQQKRLARTPRRGETPTETTNQFQQKEIEFVEIKTASPPPPILAVIPVAPPPNPTMEEEEAEEDDPDEQINVTAIGEMFGEDIADLDDDDDDWDEEDDEDEGEVSLGIAALYSHPLAKTAQLQVLPLSVANFPKICYLVIDRSAELITRPLKDFAELGKIPTEEIQQRTLPVFDSHRVARRFSKRRERVIKVPDGRMIQKTHSYLKSKGITRILLDGQIYSLSPS